ncbi:hypothetical protein VNO77_12942 [Canavalia gladiata]|uniref:Legume lectin domain-containing protein n=1 Tax=Canavalia gladiata TaxID=3824 RepID=A0AAN9LWU5_CANGL
MAKKPVSLIALLSFMMVLNRVNSANLVSFNFESFSPDQEDLILQGDASISNNMLQMTKLDSNESPMGHSVGRAMFYAPVRLWESSAVEASFETTFTFKMSTPDDDSSPGDGMAFFIASPDTTIPPCSDGMLLGLFPNTEPLKNSSSSSCKNQITLDFNDNLVAVEFDTFPNEHIDPDCKHIGIDVNSIISKNTTKFEWQNGKVATAHINYNSASQRLAVVATYPGTTPKMLFYDMQLNAILPQWVRVGFSASTGQNVQTNTILSWSFTSRFEDTFLLNKDMHIATVV